MAALSTKGETSIKRAAMINMATRYSAAFLHLCYSILLARILSPSDYGLVSMAQVFVTFLALFQDMGLGAAIVQRQDLTKQDISRLFAFTVVLSVVLSGLLLVGGIPLSIIYREAELRPICAILSISTFFSALNTIPSAMLRKDRRFVAVGVRQITCVIIASILGLTSAKMGAGPYAIVIYSVTNSLLNFLWNYASYRIIPSFFGMLEPVKKVFSYSAYLFMFNLVTYFTRNADNILIGYFFGAADLGNYAKAYSLMQYPQTYLTSIVTNVLHPMLAHKQDDIEHIYRFYVRLVKALSLVGVFISIFCFFSAHEIVDVLYGGKWVQAGECLKWLSISIWCQMIAGTSGSMFQLLNKTKEQFVRGVLTSLLIVFNILVGTWMGSIEMVALGVGIGYWGALLLMLPFLIRRSFNKSMLGFARLFVPDFAIALLLVLVHVAIAGFIPGGLVGLLTKLAITLVAYAVLVVVFGQLRWLLVLLPRRMRSAVPQALLRGGGE